MPININSVPFKSRQKLCFIFSEDKFAPLDPPASQGFQAPPPPPLPKVIPIALPTPPPVICPPPPPPMICLGSVLSLFEIPPLNSPSLPSSSSEYKYEH